MDKHERNTIRDGARRNGATSVIEDGYGKLHVSFLTTGMARDFMSWATEEGFACATVDVNEVVVG